MSKEDIAGVPCQDAIILVAWLVVDAQEARSAEKFSLVGPGKFRMIDIEKNMLVEVTGPSHSWKEPWRAEGWTLRPTGKPIGEDELTELAAAVVGASRTPDFIHHFTLPRNAGAPFPENILSPVRLWVEETAAKTVVMDVAAEIYRRGVGD